jgi:aldehyde dehydrogenase (NAD+)
MGTNFGPVVDKQQLELVHDFIEKGKKEATLVCGGYRHDGPGNWIPPTLFRDPAPEAAIYKQEIIGPVLTVKTFKTEEEVIELANDSEFGLAGKICLSFFLEDADVRSIYFLRRHEEDF